MTYLNPDMDTLVEKGDKRILLEEDDGAFEVLEIVTNPLKSDKVTYGEEDYLIVIARE